MGAKSGEVCTSRAVQRENEADGDIGNPRRESENERGMPSSLYRSLPETVLVGGFVGVEGELSHWVVLVMLGWWQRRWRRRVTKGCQEREGGNIPEWKRKPGKREIGGGTREETEDEKDLNGRRGVVVGRMGRKRGRKGGREEEKGDR